MDNKLKALVKEIKYRKSWTTLEVAKSIGYSREHLTTEMNKGENNDIILLLQEKHSDILQNVNNGNHLREEQSEYGKNAKDQSLTIQTLVNLTESNRLQAASLKDMASSHKELVMMLKKKEGITGDDHSRNAIEIHGVVLAMRELLTHLAAKVNKQTVGEIDDSLDKMVKVAIESLEQKDIAAADGKQDKH